MWPNSQFSADIATFIEEILNRKLHFSSNVNEVITAVLNFLFFLRKDFARTKSTKGTKTQPSKRTKTQISK